MLSERLQKIADLIEYGETMADIGTDHGFLPVYLIKSGKCPYAISTDISRNSLKKAEELILSESLSRRCSARVGDGLDPIEIGEVDDVVIAGMGGILMAEILSADKRKSHAFKNIILQPRSKLAYLRRWARENGFFIKKETLAKEVDRFCEILLVETSKNPDLFNSECDVATKHNSEIILENGFLITDYFPETLIEDPNELTLDYLHYHLNKNESILSKLKNNMSNDGDNAANVDNARRMNDFEKVVNHLKMLINKYGEKNSNDAY